MAVAISTLSPEQGSLQVMTIILMTPMNETDCAIRVVSSVKLSIDTPLNRLARRLLGFGLEDVLSRVFLALATKDFDGDADDLDPSPVPVQSEAAARRRPHRRLSEVGRALLAARLPARRRGRAPPAGGREAESPRVQSV